MKNLLKTLLASSIVIGGLTCPLIAMDSPPPERNHTSLSTISDESKALFYALRTAILDANVGIQEISQLLNRFIESTNYVWVEDEAGDTLLIDASSAGRSEIVHLLLEKGADPKHTNKMDMNALDCALQGNHEKVIELLLGTMFPKPSSKENIPNSSAQEITSLADLDSESLKAFCDTMTAIQRGQVTDVRNVLKHYPYFTKLSDAYGNTLLIKAVKAYNLELVQHLLELGAPVDQAEAYGNTPLSFAARAGNLEMVKLLLTYKADVNKHDKSMFTPLARALAVKNKHTQHDDVIKLLISYGGYVYAKVAIYLVPVWRYRAADLSARFAIRKDYLTKRLRDGLNLIDPDKMHMSIAYMAMPISYTASEGEDYLKQGDHLAQQIQLICYLMNLQHFLVSAHASDPFRWDTTKWLGNFLVASYRGPQYYSAFINNFYRGMMAQMPGLKKIYEHEEQPHISIGKIKRDGGLSPHLDGVLNPIASGTPQCEMFDGTSELVISVRIPSQNGDTGYQEFLRELK